MEVIKMSRFGKFRFLLKVDISRIDANWFDKYFKESMTE